MINSIKGRNKNDIFNYSKKKVLPLVGILLVGIAFILGFKLFKENSNTITHSIQNIIEIEKDGYTHEIVSAYILDEQIYLDIFYYKTDVGMTFSLQEGPDSANNYWIYYSGKKCNKYSQSYGSTISLSYRSPSVKAGKAMEFSLYSGDKFISEIKLFPKGIEFNKEIPYTTANDITLTANVQTFGDQIQVFVNAILPQNAEGKGALVNQCASGFSEDDIYIQDSRGIIYRDISTNSSDEDICMHRLYHIFYFDIPKDICDFTIIIPQITYKLKNAGFMEKYGPWEIEIKQ